MNSLEALNNIIAKYDWLGKEYCRLIGKGENLHKVNQETFEELANTIKQDLERLEALEKEKTELLLAHSRVLKSSSETNSLTLDILKENEKLKKALDILKRNLVIEFNDDLRFIHLKEDISQSCDYTIIDIEDQQEYELLKEVLDND